MNIGVTCNVGVTRHKIFIVAVKIIDDENITDLILECHFLFRCIIVYFLTCFNTSKCQTKIVKNDIHQISRYYRKISVKQKASLLYREKAP